MTSDIKIIKMFNEPQNNMFYAAYTADLPFDRL